MRSVVVDTNVIVSAALTAMGKPAEIIRLISAGKICLYYSEGILAEYIEVLSRPKLKISPEIQTDIIMALQENGILVSTPTSSVPLADETDRIFYDTAKASGAILITGNSKHYPAEMFIMTPSEFLISVNQ